MTVLSGSSVVESAIATHIYLLSKENCGARETFVQDLRFVYFLLWERKRGMTTVVQYALGGCLLLCLLQTYLAEAQE